jgi:hypothetical protein
VLIIREPEALPGHGSGHGLPGDEVQRLMLQAGLQEISSVQSDTFPSGISMREDSASPDSGLACQ